LFRFQLQLESFHPTRSELLLVRNQLLGVVVDVVAVGSINALRGEAAAFLIASLPNSSETSDVSYNHHTPGYRA
jgi:hypothetical protein